MANAVLARCQEIINGLLDRNRTAWSTTGATGANKIAAYGFDQEIDAALLRADGLVITECYFRSKSLGLRNRFMTSSGNVTSGAPMPEFAGLIGKAEWSTDNITFKPSNKVDDDDDMFGLQDLGSYISTDPSLAYGFHRFGNDGYVYHTSPYFRFFYPFYTKTSALQSLEQHEPLIVNWAMELLYKRFSPEFQGFDWYKNVRKELADRVTNGDMFLEAAQPMRVGEEG